jgi:DNA-binding NarL/FixJ family response regulator
MTTIRIGIADDHQVFREGVIVGLRADPTLQVVLQAEDGEDLLQQLTHQQPDIIIMDLKMPRMDGVAATRIVRQQWPQIKVLAVTMYDDDKIVAHLVENGAHGYLVKNSEPEEMIAALHSVYAYHYYFSANMRTALLARLYAQGHIQPLFPSPQAALSHEEAALLQQLAQGSEQSVDDHTPDWPASSPLYQPLMAKTGVHTLAGLRLYAMAKANSH